jgi:hypothetical protein
MTKTDNNLSFRATLQAQLNAYAKPILIEGKQLTYVRAIVSGFNTSNGTSYSVLTRGKGLLVGLRADCRNYEEQPVEQLPVAPPTVELSAAQHFQRAVELLRAEKVSREEMHAELSKYITSEDDYLI